MFQTQIILLESSGRFFTPAKLRDFIASQDQDLRDCPWRALDHRPDL